MNMMMTNAFVTAVSLSSSCLVVELLVL